MKYLKRILFVVIIYLLEKGLLYFDNHTDYFANYAHGTLLSLIIIGLFFFTIIFFFKISVNKNFVFRVDDELSSARKYQLGYSAYFFSLILWLFLFFDRINFSDISNLIGGGIILSLLIGIILTIASRIRPYEEQN